MKMTFRHYGPSDPVTLEQISQIPGMYSIVSAVYDVPAGGVWSEESINAIKASAEAHGLKFEVVESVPVPIRRDFQIVLFKRISHLSFPHTFNEHRFLRVQSVFRLVENFVCVRFEYFRRDLLFPMRGQAMEHHCFGVCDLHHFRVDLIIFKNLLSLFRFTFLTHRRPNVGVEYVGVFRRLEHVVGNGEFPVFFRPRHQFCVRLVALGTSYGNFHAHFDTADDQRVRHIVPVADIAKLIP